MSTTIDDSDSDDLEDDALWATQKRFARVLDLDGDAGSDDGDIGRDDDDVGASAGDAGGDYGAEPLAAAAQGAPREQQEVFCISSDDEGGPPAARDAGDDDDAVVIVDDDEASAAARTPAQRQATLTSSRLTGGFVRDGLAMLMASSRAHGSAVPGAGGLPARARSPAAPAHKRTGPDAAAATPASSARRGSLGGGSIAASGGRAGAPQGPGRASGRSMFRAATGPPPFYKCIPGTPLVVDGFQWASARTSQHYILTHFHADHYGGLTKAFDAGVIYCTPATAALVQARLHVAPRFLRPIALDAPTRPAGLGGTSLTFIDANHCPGAAMVLVEVPAVSPAAAPCAPPAAAAAAGMPLPPTAPARAFLHTGDFRWHAGMARSRFLAPYLPQALAAGAGLGASLALRPHAPARPHAPLPRRLEALFLDTTYSDPAYCFPPQSAVVAAAVDAVRPFAADPGVLLLFGSYTIGKERLFMAVARALGERVFVDAAKHRTLSLLGWPLDELATLTTDPTAARIQVVPMAHLSLSRLAERLKALRSAPAWRPAAGTARAATPRAGGGSGSGSALATAGARSAGGATPGTASGLRGGGPPAKRGRGAYFSALLQQSRDSACAAGDEHEGAADVGDDAGLVCDGEAPSEGGFFKPPQPASAPNGLAALMAGAAAAAAAASAAAAAPRFGPFHSILAFRPTGWAHAGNGSGGNRGAGAHGGSASASASSGAPSAVPSLVGSSLPGDTCDWLDMLSQLQAHGGAVESSWERGDGLAADAAPGGLDGDAFSQSQLPQPAAVGASNVALLRALQAAGPVQDTRQTRAARGVEVLVALPGDDEARAAQRHGRLDGAGGAVVRVGSGRAEAAAASPAASHLVGATGQPLSPAACLQLPQPQAPPQQQLVRVRMMVQTRGGGAAARARPLFSPAAGGSSGSSNGGSAPPAGRAAGGKRRHSIALGSDVAAATPHAGGGGRLRAAAGAGGGGVTLLSLPYSEHSSFDELRAAVAALAPRKVIPTVNCRSAAEAAALVARLRA